MPSNNNQTAIRTNPQIVFSLLVFLSLILWIFYRALFNFPVIFDETLGKAVFFGAPIFIYLNVIKEKKVLETISLNKLFPGLLRGLAYGGLFSFLAIAFALIKNNTSLVSAPVFILDQFWLEMFLALLTAFWESLFFFAFMQTVIGSVFKKLSELEKIFAVSLIFLFFHLPNILLRFSGFNVGFMIMLLYLFGLGQAIIFAKEKNAYTLMMTHTIWGVILMLHF